MDLHNIAEYINLLSDFLGKRDLDSLSGRALEEKYQIDQADLLILFGGSIPYGCDVVGEALLSHISKNFMIVGGEGHTTESLRKAIHDTCPEIVTERRMEADIMEEYIRRKYKIEKILIERESTNCGNNVTNALKIMKQHKICPKSIILVQDSTMQRRMDAGFRKYLPNSSVQIINFASYKVRVDIKNEKLIIEPADIWGMWDIKRYVSLLMSEIPRLLDNVDGYGPNGKNYIAHVDIPPNVFKAFEALKDMYGDMIRMYATGK